MVIDAQLARCRAQSDLSRETSRRTKAGPWIRRAARRWLVHAADGKRVFRADRHDRPCGSTRLAVPRSWRGAGRSPSCRLPSFPDGTGVVVTGTVAAGGLCGVGASVAIGGAMGQKRGSTRGNGRLTLAEDRIAALLSVGIVVAGHVPRTVAAVRGRLTAWRCCPASIWELTRARPDACSTAGRWRPAVAVPGPIEIRPGTPGAAARLGVRA